MEGGHGTKSFTMTPTPQSEAKSIGNLLSHRWISYFLG